MKSRKSICIHPSGQFEAKSWGSTRELFKSARYSLHEMKIVRGGYSSVHFHRFKSNYVYILSGTLEILTFRRYYTYEDVFARITVYTKGSLVKLSPFCIHKFYAKSDVHALEWYTSPLFVFRNDIYRFTSNGVRVRET